MIIFFYFDNTYLIQNALKKHVSNNDFSSLFLETCVTKKIIYAVEFHFGMAAEISK
jgi:hypothetical protein